MSSLSVFLGLAVISEEMDNAIKLAITTIQEQIKTKTDPLTLLLGELVGDTDPQQSIR